MNALEVAGQALANVDGQAIARVVRERSLMLRFAGNRPTQSTAVDDVTVEVAVIRRGHVGRATTNRTDSEGLAGCARRATEAAAVAATAGPGDHPDLFVAPGETAVLEGAFDPATALLDPAPGGAAMAAAFEVARRSGLEAHGTWTVAEQEHAVTDGEANRTERTTDAYMKVICIDPRSRRSGYAARAAQAVAELDGRALAERAAAKTVVDGKPVELAPGEYSVVMEPPAVGELLDLFAASALNGLAHVEGRGALAGQLGSRVAAPAVNLADSPRYRLTLPRSFDAEGTDKRPVPLIEDGVAKNVVHDWRSAALAGVKSTGHALAPGGDPMGPHPTNLVLAGGGASDVEELCGPIERGLYITRLWYSNLVRPKETLITAVTRDGTFLIEDGVAARPVRDLRLTDSLLGILSRVQALTAAQKLTTDGEFYGRRFAYGVVCPALRVGSVRFTGATG